MEITDAVSKTDALKRAIEFSLPSISSALGELIDAGGPLPLNIEATYERTKEVKENDRRSRQATGADSEGLPLHMGLMPLLVRRPSGFYLRHKRRKTGLNGLGRHGESS